MGGAKVLLGWDAEVFTFGQEEIEKLARMEHDRWMADLMSDGWKYAPGPKSPEKKTHPCLVPWAELTEEVREIDREMIRALPGFLRGVGFGIRQIST